MAKLVFSLMTSLDGYAAREAAPNDWTALDWHRVDDSLNRDIADLFARAGGLVLGRVTYEGFAAYWPHAAPERDATEQIIADQMNRLEKIVVSRKLDALPWGPARVVRDLEALAALKRERDRDLVFLAGPTLGGALANAGLVDEAWLHVHPIALGRGLPTFKGLAREWPLALVEAKPRESGVVTLRYARADDGGDDPTRR